MSTLAKDARRMLRELEFETFHRALTEGELADLRVIAGMSRDLLEREEPCRRERAARSVA